MKKKLQFKKLLLMALMLVGAGTAWATNVTVTLSISDYASDNGWENQSQYTSVTVGNVTFNANGGSNTGKYYTTDDTWRFYANESAKLKISVPEGCSLVSVKPTFTVKDNGTLVYGSSTLTSGTAIDVSGELVEFTISSSSGSKGKVFFTEIEVVYSTSTPTCATPTFSPEAGAVASGTNVTISCETEGATIYYTTNGSTPSATNGIQGTTVEITEATTIKAIAVKEDYDDSQVATAAYTIIVPSIVFEDLDNPYTTDYLSQEVDVPYVATNTTGELAVVLCDADGNTATYDWFTATLDSDHSQVIVTLTENDDPDSRTAYFKVTAGDVASVIFTIIQNKFIPDYATLPFEFDGGLNDITSTDGLTQDGLDTDYGSSPKLKFNSTGDWVILKLNERPGTLTFDIKGNSFSGGTFTVQTSENGVTYTDLETYTELGATQNEEFSNLGENVRYIKWIYTNKSSGNVALGNIALAKYVEPVLVPSVTVTPSTINAPVEGADGTLALASENISDFISFDYYFCDDEGEALEENPDWIYAEIQGYSLDYLIDSNDGAARTAYIKVYTYDDEEEEVSAIVTVTQEAALQQYTLTVEPFENLELITFVNDEMVMEGDGTIQVNEDDVIMLSIVADEGYVMETLMVNGVNHVNDIADDFTYTFDMPAENVTISATAVENVAPVGGNYVRITSLDQLTDNCKVIIAARYDEEHTNGYYAMPGETSGKPTGVAFTSETSGNYEILPATITASEDTYYWTVNVTNDGYTFTNSDNHMIGYTSSTNFATDGNNTEWTITRETADESAMVGGHTGFVIRNGNTDTRAFAFNGSKFGAYATGNMTDPGYNFFLDFFVQGEPITVTAAGLATYASDNALDFSNVTGLEAYAAEEENCEIKLTKVTEVPAGEGVLLRAKAITETTTFIVPVIDEATTWTEENNCFVRGTGDAVASEVQTNPIQYNYILNRVGGVLGFYRANNQMVATDKAYLQTSINASTEGGRLLIRFDDETPGISNNNRETITNNRYFDLQGRQVAQPTKGLYIVNGKKVIIR